MIANYFVWVAYVDQAYGGPEEGGWWYDTGIFVFRGEEDSPLDCLQCFENEADAESAYEMLKILVNAANSDRRPPHSVLSSGYWMQAMMTRNAPKSWPSECPHYE